MDAWGYPYVYDSKETGWKIRKAHRVVWEHTVGLIPQGVHLHHVCRNRTCTNPDHLEPLTATEHTLEHARMRRESNPTCKKCGADEWGFRKDDPSKRYCKACNRRRYQEAKK